MTQVLPGRIAGIAELTAAGVDANAASVTASLDIGGAKLVMFQALAATGTHATHIITLQCSPDDSNFYDVSGATLTGVGAKDGIEVGAQFVRLKVTTVEGGVSTVDVIIQAK